MAAYHMMASEQSFVTYDGTAHRWRRIDAVRLAGRETQVLQLLAKGLEVSAITARVGITSRHFWELCRVLMEKLGAEDVERLRSISVEIYKVKAHEPA